MFHQEIHQLRWFLVDIHSFQVTRVLQLLHHQIICKNISPLLLRGIVVMSQNPHANFRKESNANTLNWEWKWDPPLFCTFLILLVPNTLLNTTIPLAMEAGLCTDLVSPSVLQCSQPLSLGAICGCVSNCCFVRFKSMKCCFGPCHLKSMETNCRAHKARELSLNFLNWKIKIKIST